MSSSKIWLVLTLTPVCFLLSACSGGSDGNSGGSSGVIIEDPYDPLYPSIADDYENNGGDETPATSSTITIGESQARTLWPIGDVDYVKVDLAAGTSYEFSVNQLCVACDTYMSLYDTDGTTLLATNDDYLGLDSRLLFTPTVAGAYHLKIESFKEAYRVTVAPTPGGGLETQKGDDYGVSVYTLSAHVFTDGDGDSYSSYYDCNDNDATVYPWAGEVAGDGLNQNCSGTDQLAPATADAFEPDNSPATAKSMYMANIGLWEIQFQQLAWEQNARTIDAPGDKDYFTFTLGPRRGAYLNMHTGSYPVNLLLTLYDSDGTTVLGTSGNDPLAPTDWPTHWVANDTYTDKTFYVSYAAADGNSTAWYVPALYYAGVDSDDDGYYTRDWGAWRDCNDRNAGIHPGAPEKAGDGVDTNCNGDDNT